MRTIWGIVLLILVVTVACAGRTAAPAGGAAKPNSPGAQAAARLTAQAYDGFEKKIATTFPALEKHLAAGQAPEAVMDAEQLAIMFGDIEQFWAQNNKANAVTWAQEAARFATQIAGAATAGDVAKARQIAATMQRTCTQCHRAYRESDAAGGFQIKSGTLTR